MVLGFNRVLKRGVLFGPLPNSELTARETLMYFGVAQVVYYPAKAFSDRAGAEQVYRAICAYVPGEETTPPPPPQKKKKQGLYTL